MGTVLLQGLEKSLKKYNELVGEHVKIFKLLKNIKSPRFCLYKHIKNIY